MFSIATIVYNDHSHILKTINSVVSQSFHEIEYILIDGKSTDGTSEKIYQYLQEHTHITLQEMDDERIYIQATHLHYPTLTFKFLSEKDCGIYDAMNKGIQLASQDWINFMNCGDSFYDLEVLEKIAREDISQYDVIYGDTKVQYQDFSTIKQAPIDLHTSLRKFGLNLIHQSTFFKTSIHKQFPYNTSDYKLASDYLLFYQLFDKKFLFHKIDLICSIFHCGGSSDIQGLLRTKESLHIAQRFSKNPLSVYPYFLIASMKKIIKTQFPHWFVKKLIALQK